MKIDLPGGLEQSEITALRRLARELAADGYTVGKVGLGAGDTPCALVYAGKKGDPIRAIVIGARSILRAVEAVEGIELEVSAVEFETLQALRSTSAVLAQTCDVLPADSIGEVAHEAFARQARAGANLKEE